MRKSGRWGLTPSTVTVEEPCIAFLPNQPYGVYTLIPICLYATVVFGHTPPLPQSFVLTLPRGEQINVRPSRHIERYTQLM
jgi:hypothetical protein